LSFTRARTVDDQGDPITITRRLAAPTGDRLVWDNRVRPLDGVTLGYTLDHVARLTDVSNGVEERPGYTLHSVQAQWEPEMLPGLALNLAVHNLLDLRYSEQTSIYSSTVDPIVEPGRDVRLGFTYSF
jgi:hemoglobin/transferrin/lactoferrin receptor protein